MQRLRNTLFCLFFCLGLVISTLIAFNFLFVFIEDTRFFHPIFIFNNFYPIWFLHFVNYIVTFNSFFYAFLPFPAKYLGLATPIIGAPIMEELEFRGPIWLVRHSKNKWFKYGLVIITSLLFGLCHRRGIAPTLLICTMGFISSGLVLKTKRIWPSQILHGLYNALVSLI